jgi:hypothetical protein
MYAEMVENCNHNNIADGGGGYGKSNTEVEVATMPQKQGECYEKNKRRENEPEYTPRKGAYSFNILCFNIEPDHRQHRNQRDRREYCTNQCITFSNLRDDHNESGGDGDFREIKCHFVLPLGPNNLFHRMTDEGL